ncbi:Fusicoccadiene synthase 3 [Colletotrichum kahawae]|uniref:Fusicoccadiene synthase 3 n=1 Tax=Colletotrichum kahawae TaxID=34407 RepID=A0AAD9Y395_COLKA|nr:Fusicoccadiene synthase 3 [Colletotrichum kahawae]
MAIATLYSKYYLEYQHSEALNPSQYCTEGFCAEFVLRKRFDDGVAVAGCEAARADWGRMVGLKSTRAGCENVVTGSFATLCLPMIASERMWITGYIFEYAFLHDNLTDATKQTDALNEQLVNSLSTAMKPQILAAEAKSGMKQMHEFMTERILSIDKVTGMKILKAWKRFISHGAGSGKNIHFDSFDSFVNYRLVDVAGEWVDYVMRFGMSLNLTDEEERCAAPLSRLAYLIAALHNDYVSFDVEYAIFRDDGEAESLHAFTNGVWVMMYLNGMGVDEAKEAIKVKTQAYENEFLRLWQDLTQNERATENVMNSQREKKAIVPVPLMLSMRTI